MGDDDSSKKVRGTFLRPNSAIIKGPSVCVDRPKVSPSSFHRKRELNFLQKLMTRFDILKNKPFCFDI